MSEPDSQLTKPASVPQERLASEFLANERTFLAWIRTSIAVVSLGFLISRFALWLRSIAPEEATNDSRHSSTSVVIGVIMMAFGALLAILAVWRYHVVNRHIEEGQIRPDRGLVIMVTILVVLLALGMIVVILVNG